MRATAGQAWAWPAEAAPAGQFCPGLVLFAPVGAYCGAP